MQNGGKHFVLTQHKYHRRTTTKQIQIQTNKQALKRLTNNGYLRTRGKRQETDKERKSNQEKVVYTHSLFLSLSLFLFRPLPPSYLPIDNWTQSRWRYLMQQFSFAKMRAMTMTTTTKRSDSSLNIDHTNRI